MKKFLTLTFLIAGFSANAISFISEDDVKNHLGAEKVIRISKYSVQDLLEKNNQECYQNSWSKSAQAFVVQKLDENDYPKAALYLTVNELNELEKCYDL